jgi:hypothetical protein
MTSKTRKPQRLQCSAAAIRFVWYVLKGSDLPGDKPFNVAGHELIKTYGMAKIKRAVARFDAKAYIMSGRPIAECVKGR